MEAANKVVTTAVERPSEATSPVKNKKYVMGFSLFLMVKKYFADNYWERIEVGLK